MASLVWCFAALALAAVWPAVLGATLPSVLAVAWRSLLVAPWPCELEAFGCASSSAPVASWPSDFIAALDGRPE
eukprot:8057166-Alexandrium_andersonii.AAC.1